MNGTIKAIETQYKGYRFRSRLEARWAVFFDALGLRWEYEKEGYDLGAAGWYLPDFWLPEWEMWTEIKPSSVDIPTSDETKERMFQLSNMTGHDALLISGTPGYDHEWEFTYEIQLFGGERWWGQSRYGEYVFYWPGSSSGWNYDWVDSLIDMLGDEVKSGKYINPEDVVSCPVTDMSGLVNKIVELDRVYYLRKYGEVHPRYRFGKRTGVNFSWGASGKFKLEEMPIYPSQMHEGIIRAFEAARSVRFEHGETPI